MQTTHEKIIKRTDGTRVKIRVHFDPGYRGNEYWSKIETCQPRKRTWVGVVDENDWDYRRMSGAKRAEAEEKATLDHVSAEEIMKAKLELWEKLRPESI